MEDRSIRKRRLTDDAGVSVSTEHAASANSASPRPFQPPSNKRLFTGNQSPAQSSSPVKDDSELMTPAEEVLHTFQKEAIWRQMQEYKRENARAQETIDKLKKSQMDYESHLSTINIYWEQFLDDLKMLMARVNLKFEPEDLILKDGSSFASFLLSGSDETVERKEIEDITEVALKSSLRERSEYTKQVVLKLLQLIEQWSEQRQSFWTSLRDSDPAVKESSTVRQLSDEHAKLEELYKKGQTNIDQLQAKCHSFTEQVLKLRNELEMTRNRLQETSDELDDSKERLRRVEKNFDRERSKLVQAVTSGAVFGENYNGGASASTTPGVGSDGNKDSDATREEVLQFRELARTRLVELEEMKAQRIQLKNEVDSLRLQLNQLPDERIQDSTQYKQLLVAMQYARNEADHHRNEASRLRDELGELEASRRTFIQTLEDEEKARRAALEAELKRLEGDLSRVRDSRDRFQQMYEARCTKDDYEMQQNQEIRKIANTRKDRILTLTADIQRLQIMLAAKTGDKDAFAFYLKGSTDKSLLDDLRQKLKTAEDQIQKLHVDLEAAQEAAAQARELEAALVSEKTLKRQVDELTKKLVRFEELLGEHSDDAVKALMAKVQQHEATIQQLELKVQAHEAVQTPLVNELHTVATAWAQLEEATSRKVIDLAQKEDLIYKLLSDKTRQESKCALLNRAKDTASSMNTVLKRQSDMQFEQIRRLEEREKNLASQVTLLEREQGVLNNSVATHKARLQDFTQQNSAFKEKFRQQDERLNELQNLLKERTDHYENEAHLRRRLQEEVDALKRKIEEHSKQEGSAAESEAAKNAARYLKLLKCPACDVNFKSHVILRCMHVFCKSCMDNQMEYRQRKCPTCRENFGAKDVKEIYL